MDEREGSSSGPFILFHLYIFYLLLFFFFFFSLNHPGMIKAQNGNGKNYSQTPIHIDLVLSDSVCDGL